MPEPIFPLIVEEKGEFVDQYGDRYVDGVKVAFANPVKHLRACDEQREKQRAYLDKHGYRDNLGTATITIDGEQVEVEGYASPDALRIGEFPGNTATARAAEAMAIYTASQCAPPPPRYTWWQRLLRNLRDWWNRHVS